MNRMYVGTSTDYPGAVRVDEEGDLEVGQLSVSTFVRLTPEAKLSLATDLVRSAILDMQADSAKKDKP